MFGREHPVIYRALGATGVPVSVIGLGCAHLGARGSGTTRADAVRLLERAVDRGITFFDSADIYGAGESERVLGDVLSRHRDRMVIATKVGFRTMIPEALVARVRPYLRSAARRGGSGASLVATARTFFRRADYSVDYLQRSVEASLTRLRIDRIDVLQLHSPSARALDRDHAMETLERLAAQGKIRFHGLAFATCGQAARALRDGLSTLQVPVSIGAPAAVDHILGWAQQRGIGVIANQPLRRGALLREGVAYAWRRAQPDGIRTLPQAALRFVASLSAVSTVIVGTTNAAHLDENVAALDAPPLTNRELAGLRGECAT